MPSDLLNLTLAAEVGLVSWADIERCIRAAVELHLNLKHPVADLLAPREEEVSHGLSLEPQTLIRSRT